MVVYEEIPLTNMMPTATPNSTCPNVSNVKPTDCPASSSTMTTTSNHRSRSSQNLFSACHRSSDDDKLNDTSEDDGQDINNNNNSRSRLDVECGRGKRSRSLSRRSSVASHLYSSLRRRSMLRLSPLSVSLMSARGEPLGQEVRNIEDYPVDGGYDDDGGQEEGEDDEAGLEDTNNNPLVEDPREHHHSSTLKITPSIVRRIPAMRRESKYFPGRIRKRVILKNGNVNLSPEHVDKRHRRFLQDMFTTMVDIRWRWNLLVFTMGFLLSWFGFAVIWWLIAFSHSDFEHLSDPTWTPCINNLNSFASAILFSIETQHTIGYGSRYTTEECPEAMFVMCLQSITGVMIQCFMVGFVFAKLSRPQKRSQTLVFSRHAITCLRDGKLCIMFRVGDLRDRSHIIGANIHAQLIKKKITEEGEVIPYYHRDLSVRFDETTANDLLLIWPAIIVHEIDQDSPFYLMNCEAMMKEKFEIIVILEGTIESTGQSVQARTSYLPSEILWGHRFEQLVRYRNDTGEYLVDYSKFNNTFPMDIPTHSAKEFHEDVLHRERVRKYHQYSPKETDLSSPALLLPNGTAVSSPLVFQYPSTAIARPTGPPPPPPTFPLLSESQRERIKFYAQ